MTSLPRFRTHDAIDTTRLASRSWHTDSNPTTHALPYLCLFSKSPYTTTTTPRLRPPLSSPPASVLPAVCLDMLERQTAQLKRLYEVPPSPACTPPSFSTRQFTPPASLQAPQSRHMPTYHREMDPSAKIEGKVTHFSPPEKPATTIAEDRQVRKTLLQMTPFKPLPSAFRGELECILRKGLDVPVVSRPLWCCHRSIHACTYCRTNLLEIVVACTYADLPGCNITPEQTRRHFSSHCTRWSERTIRARTHRSKVYTVPSNDRVRHGPFDDSTGTVIAHATMRLRMKACI